MLVPLAEGGWGTRRGLDDDKAEAPPTTPAVAMAMVTGVVKPFLVVLTSRDMKAFLKEEQLIRTATILVVKAIKPGKFRKVPHIAGNIGGN